MEDEERIMLLACGGEDHIVLCKAPVLLKDGGELTTDQQTSIMNTFQVTCTTRPVRNGRAGRAGADSEDTRSWRELTFWGPSKKLRLQLKKPRDFVRRHACKGLWKHQRSSKSGLKPKMTGSPI